MTDALHTDSSELLDLLKQSEMIILRNAGREFARTQLSSAMRERLPDLTAFRAMIVIKGDAMSATLLQQRAEERI